MLAPQPRLRLGLILGLLLGLEAEFLLRLGLRLLLGLVAGLLLGTESVREMGADSLESIAGPAGMAHASRASRGLHLGPHLMCVA